MNTTGLDYLLLQLHTVVTGYMYYRFYPVDCVLTTTLLYSLSVLGFGANLCDPHVCPCSTFVNSHGTHGLSCKRGSSKLTGHAIINNLIHRALVRARIPSTMEPTGLSRSDGKRPDGLTLVPWSAGKSII